MRSLIQITGAILLGAGALTHSAKANWSDLTQNTGLYSYGDGGEFNAVTGPAIGVASSDFLEYYAPVAKFNNGLGLGFQTFCVEETVFFNPGANYSYTLGQVDGGGNPLTKGAAWLYEQFGTGVLAGYDYLNTDPSNTRLSDAGALQDAIWAFQGQMTLSPSDVGTANNPAPNAQTFYQDAVNALGGLANAKSPNNGDFAVDILQMWDPNHNQAQNQLVLAPDSGASVWLLGLAAAGLAALRRRWRS